MKNQDKLSANLDVLRQKAEELLKKKVSEAPDHITKSELHKLLHQSEIAQIELEVQNKELQSANTAAQEAIDLFDFAPIGYFTFNQVGEIVRLNLYGAEMLGKDRSLLQNSRFGFFISDDSKPVFNSFIEKIFKSKTKQTCDLTIGNNDALPMFVHLNGIIAGNTGNCLVSATDITERKQAELELQASKKLIEEIINTIPAGVFWKDKNLNYLGGNASFAKDAGFSDPKDIVGKNDFEMGWSNQADLYRADDQFVIDSGKPRLNIEEPQTTPDGKTIALLTNKIPLKILKARLWVCLEPIWILPVASLPTKHCSKAKRSFVPFPSNRPILLR